VWELCSHTQIHLLMTTLHNNQSSHSNLWVLLSGFSTLVMLLALISNSSFSSLLSNQSLSVAPEETQSLQPIQLTPTAIGGLQIDVTAGSEQNHWVSYEIQVRDAQNQLIASAIKDAWNESGYEEGENWAEADLTGGLDLKANQPETLTVSIQVLEHTDTLGQDVATPVTFQVTAINGVLDSRFFWAGLIGTGTITVLLVWLRSKNKKP
jgi:hypothetical protein